MQRLLLITNPYGGLGRGREISQEVVDRLAGTGWEVDVRETTGPGVAAALARDADPDRYAGLGAIGGDGTLHEVVNGLSQQGGGASRPIAVFPGGTSNSFAHTLGPGDVSAITASIVRGITAAVDAAEVRYDDTERLAVSIIHCGAPVTAARRAERLRWLGPARYQLGSLSALAFSRRRRYALEVDGERMGAPATLMVQLTRGPARGEDQRWCLAPRLAMDDGKLDVIALAPMSRLRQLRVFGRSRDGSYVDEPEVDYRKVRSLSFAVPPGEVLNVDGEFRAVQDGKVEIQVRPAAFRVFKPIAPGLEVGVTP